MDFHNRYRGFAAEVMSTATRVRHTVEIAAWSVDNSPFAYTAAGTSEWGTARRNAGWLLHDALNSATPQIFDTVMEDGRGEARPQQRSTEAAKEKLAKIKEAFPVGSGPTRTAPTGWPASTTTASTTWCRGQFDGRHLTLPRRPATSSASTTTKAGDLAHRCLRLDLHRPRGRRREILRHRRGIMEQKRLGLISKAMLVCPATAWLRYRASSCNSTPTARILVADETNFVKDKALPLPRPRGRRPIGRGDHHPRRLPLHPRPRRLRARNDRRADRSL